jgi:8-oxo-dGTP diphosphatase
MAKRPKVGVCLCVVRDGKVLLHKRKGGHAPGSWAFPGGHLEFGESFEEGVLRELAEEAGPIKTTTPKLWTVANTVFHDEKKHYVVVFMIAQWLSGEALVMEPKKCECWDWFSWSNLPKPVMAGIRDLKQRGESP